jgi:hypothetical protein
VAKIPTPTAAKPKPSAKPARRQATRRPRSTLTIANVTKALQAAAGIRSVAANRLKVNRSTVTRFMQAHPAMTVVEAEIVDGIVDISLGQLFKKIGEGEFNAIKYLLDHLGGAHGFGIRRFEITGKNGGPVQTKEVDEDLSNLNVDELLALEVLLLKARTEKPRAKTR